MPLICEFDTGSVRPWHQPQHDTHAILIFSRPFPSPPRLAHGFRLLDIGNNANIRARSTLHRISESHVDCHISTWADTTLYSGVDHVLAFAPDDQEFLTGEHMRNLLTNPHDPASVRINFERPFTTPPHVVVFFNLIALDKHHNWRLRTTASDIDTNGFTLHIETWADTILYVAQACWIAYPRDRKQIFSTSVNTCEIRHWSRPQLEQNKRITFGSVQFSQNPTVFIALNSIDVGHMANLRVKAYVDGVSENGLVWHIDAWSNTILHSAGASIIAFT